MSIDDEHIVNEMIIFPTNTLSVYFIRRGPKSDGVLLPPLLLPNIQQIDHQDLFPPPNSSLATRAAQEIGDEERSQVRERIKFAQQQLMATASLLLKKEEYSHVITTHGVDKILPIRCLGNILSTPSKPDKVYTIYWDPTNIQDILKDI